MTIIERLENWGRVVRSPRFQSGVCAAWARWYVALRGTGAEPEAAIAPDERDGWAIEKCWSMLRDEEAKLVLKYTYVWRMSPDQVQTRLRKSHGMALRGKRFEVMLSEAHSAISRELVRLERRHVVESPRECEIA